MFTFTISILHTCLHIYIYMNSLGMFAGLGISWRRKASWPSSAYGQHHIPDCTSQDLLLIFNLIMILIKSNSVCWIWTKIKIWFLMKQSLQQPCSMKELLLWPWRAFWKLSNPITQLAGITKSWCWNRSLPEPGGWKSTVVLGTNICRSPQTPLTCMRMVWRSACVFLSVYHFGHFTDTHTLACITLCV